MPDHILHPPSVSTARPPTYSFDHPIINRSHEKRDDERDDAPPPQLGEQPDGLLGVPDRSASASAPPDLEISSRSLFAFKADYSGIFSDIRMDEDYESFYNENPERTKLPPPLPPSTGVTSSATLANGSSMSSLPSHEQSTTRLSGAQIGRLYNNPTASAEASSGMARLPPRGPTSANAPSPAFAPVSMHQTDPLSLRRDDSDASFEDLIFRESRTMRPTPSNPSSVNSSYREEEPSFQNQTQSSGNDSFRLHSRSERNSLRPVEQVVSRANERNLPARGRSPSPPNQYLDDTRKPLQRQEPRRPSQSTDQSQMRSSDSVEPKDVQSSLRHRQRSSPPPKQFPLPSQSNPQTSASEDAENQSTLWNLSQMSLSDRETAASVSRGASQVYSSFPSGYDSVPTPRSPFSSQYGFSQTGTGGAGAAAAAAGAAAAVAATQQSSSPSYMSQHHRSVGTQEWSQRTPTESSHKPLSSYEGSPFLTPNGTAIPDMLGLDNPDDAMLNYGISPRAMSGIPYGTVAGYRDAGGTAVPSSRSIYLSHQAPSARRLASSRGRSSSPHRLEGGRNGFGFDMYGSAGGATTYTDARGRAVPLTPEYLNAQAAAAAAAAAAAVYQSNGVHINNSGGLAQLRSASMNIGHARVGGNRGSSRPGDSRRGGVHHQENYTRGSNHANSVIRGSNGDQRILDRSGDNLSNNTSAGLKFSSFSDVVGRAEELARDQHGCRFLQTKLEEGNVVYINSIFEECYEKFVDLMTDPFGNYLCQKLFEFCNDAQRLALVERCAPAIPHVSTNMHGTRAVQRMVECLSTAEQVRAVCIALKPASVSLMKDINGNHVIQRCLHRMDPANNQFVYDAVAANCFELATHRHGCCVMQRCMDFASPMQRNQLAQQINANALPLVQNAFGNYVVQYVLELNDPVYTAEILRRLRGHIAELSMQKFSSNVVEKGLQLGSRETRRELIDELISDQETMRRLLHDAYGNYVIQRALQTAEGAQLDSICEAIRPHLHSLKQSPYGKRIQAKLLKRMPKGLAPLPPSA